MTSTRINRHLRAPRPVVYRALLDPGAIARWRVPVGMTSRVHWLDAREGGTFRVSLIYEAADRIGKTAAGTDTYQGRFVKLVADEQVVEMLAFETDDSTMKGEMMITITLADADGGTDLHVVHDGLPPGVSVVDNDTGWRMALDKLASLVEES
jgi:uncharacterized protein YndB with AHSA1/START domain